MSAPDVADPRELKRLLARHGIRAATALGQHFLVDPGALDAIVAAAEITRRDSVLEVGPGPGALTRRLARAAGSVTAVELDERMVAAATEAVGGAPNVRIVHEDALAVDLFALGPAPTRIVASLPYQITSPLLHRFLADARRPPLVVVLVQEEVARRMTASEADRERSFLSVFVQAFAEPRLVRRVPAGAFRPVPRVSSAVVALRVRPRPAFAPLEQAGFLRTVSDAFRHRRKQLRAALVESGVERDRAAAALAAAAIAPERRPEELGLPEWIALARALGVPEAR